MRKRQTRQPGATSTPDRSRVPPRLGAVGTLLGALVLLPGPAQSQGITAEVRIKTARITGDAPATRAFAGGVQEKQADLLRCYHAHLAKQPGAVGFLALTVRVDPTGKVTDVTAAPSRLPKPLVACTRQAVSAWRITPWKAPQRIYALLELLFQLSARPAPAALIKGGIPARLVAGTIEARLLALREKCWTGKEPRRSPRMRLLTDFDGTVQTASVTGRVPKRAVHQCLVTQLRAWDFPPPDNGHRTWIYYPVFPSRRPAAAEPGRSGR